uniref:Tyrosine-protein kinase n=1 Tax=Globodera rostochiensis TaxID=31243 RepID=A0A914HJJ8_GLORO
MAGRCVRGLLLLICSNQQQQPADASACHLLGSTTTCIADDISTMESNEDMWKLEYYHGLLPREDINELLTKDGDFLIRKSEETSGQERIYVLSVNVCGQNRHVIFRNERGLIAVDFGLEKGHKTIRQFIDAHLTKWDSISTGQSRPQERNHQEEMGTRAFDRIAELALAFTPKSDTWAYGVLCWEIFTNAQQPFQFVSNADVIPMVIRGKRLQFPAETPSLFPGFIRANIWNGDESRRYSIREVLEWIEQHIDDMIEDSTTTMRVDVTRSRASKQSDHSAK